MEKLFIILTCGLPCKHFKRVSLYFIGIQGLNCLSLAVDVMESSQDVDCISVVSSTGSRLEHVDGHSLVVLLGVLGVGT